MAITDEQIKEMQREARATAILCEVALALPGNDRSEAARINATRMLEAQRCGVRRAMLVDRTCPIHVSPLSVDDPDCPKLFAGTVVEYLCHIPHGLVRVRHLDGIELVVEASLFHALRM